MNSELKERKPTQTDGSVMGVKEAGNRRDDQIACLRADGQACYVVKEPRHSESF